MAPGPGEYYGNKEGQADSRPLRTADHDRARAEQAKEGVACTSSASREMTIDELIDVKIKYHMQIIEELDALRNTLPRELPYVAKQGMRRLLASMV